MVSKDARSILNNKHEGKKDRKAELNCCPFLQKFSANISTNSQSYAYKRTRRSYKRWMPPSQMHISQLQMAKSHLQTMDAIVANAYAALTNDGCHAYKRTKRSYKRWGRG